MKLICRKELSKRIGCSVTTIDRMVRMGTMPKPIKVSGMVRWPEPDIDQWIRLGCPKPEKNEEEQLC